MLTTLWACTSKSTEDLFGDPGTGTGGAGSAASGSGGTTGTGSGGDTASGTGGTTGSGTGGTDTTTGTGAGGTGGSGAGGSGNGGTGAGGTQADGGEGGDDTGGNCTPSDEICDGLDNDCNGTPDDDGTCPEDCAGFVNGGQSYMICPASSGALGGDAEAACQEESPTMHLVWIESDEENDFLHDAAHSIGIDNTNLWLGASDADDEGQWFWVPEGEQFWDDDQGPSGMPVGGNYENWNNMQPNDSHDDGENCAAMQLGAAMVDGGWNDLNCNDEEWGFICEVRP